MKLIVILAWTLIIFGLLGIISDILILQKYIFFHMVSLSVIFSFIQQMFTVLWALILARSLLKKQDMTSVEFLALILKFFGLISLSTGIVSLIESVVTFKFSLISSLSIVQSFLIGMSYLILSRRLIKKERWVWYVGVAVFVAEFIYGIAIGLLFKSTFVVLILFMDIIFIKILFKEKKTFMVEPKEKFSQWFSNPYFLFLVAGNIVLYIISAISLYLRYQK